MPEGVIILSEWNDLTAANFFILIIGLFIFVAFSGIAIYSGRDLGDNWLCLCIVLAIAGIGMMIWGQSSPKDHGYKITLNDEAKFSEVMQYYDIVDVDDLILKVKER